MSKSSCVIPKQILSSDRILYKYYLLCVKSKKYSLFPSLSYASSCFLANSCYHSDLSNYDETDVCVPPQLLLSDNIYASNIFSSYSLFRGLSNLSAMTVTIDVGVVKKCPSYPQTNMTIFEDPIIDDIYLGVHKEVKYLFDENVSPKSLSVGSKIVKSHLKIFDSLFLLKANKYKYALICS